MLVFREGGRRVALRPLLEQLMAGCRRVRLGGHDADAALAALLRAGGLECALADLGSPAAAVVAEATDALAAPLLSGGFDGAVLARLEGLAAADIPEHGLISAPEGFAYYALHPLDYVDAVAGMSAGSRESSGVMVVGIRSIGTTLSAVARAAFTARGVAAERMTVRPVGHPWERETRFSVAERERVRAAVRRGAQFLVVDEGPGLSGSSFLSVAEALLAAGVPRESVTLLGSHAANPSRMRARDAAARWECFGYLSVAPPTRLPQARGEELSGGEWRRRFLPDEREWPASWTSFERRKFLSADGHTLLKFEGLGRYGEAVRERARVLADAGFSPALRDAGNGFLAYDFVCGTPMRAEDADESLLRRLAAYCAARAERMRTSAAETAGLEQLVVVNWREAFGHEIAAPRLLVERPVIADGRMQPHEWVRANDGKLWKTDAAGHGDDHFFPGPTDIAWDLAGTMVEWQLEPAAASFFLAEYHRISGDDCSARLHGYLLAYSLFRLGYCEMAAEAIRGSEEEIRLRREAERYRRFARESREVSVAA
jgi:hypothetical protein